MVKILLIIGGNPNINWYQVFQGEKLHGKEDVQVWGFVFLVFSSLVPSYFAKLSHI
jgi:hypothetical protein